MERPVFGLSKDAINRPGDLPKYGFIADREGQEFGDIVGNGYGETFIRFKPEVRARSSVTLGDSLDGNKRSLLMSPAVPLNDPGEEMLIGGYTTASAYSDPKKWARWGRTKHFLDLVRAKPGAPYIETQIFGDLRLGDVDSILVESKKYAKTLRRALDRAGHRGIEIEAGRHHTRLSQIWEGFLDETSSLSPDDIDRLGDAWMGRIMGGTPSGMIRGKIKGGTAFVPKDLPPTLKPLVAKLLPHNGSAVEWRNAPAADMRAYLREYFRLMALGERGGLPAEHWKSYRSSHAGFTEDVANENLLVSYE